jgi:hypothetical protein
VRAWPIRGPEEGQGVVAGLPPAGSVAGGGLLLWAGMVAVSVSTVVLLAVLSHHLHKQGFAGLSALFGVLFIASLIPSGIPLRAASLIADGSAPPDFTMRRLAPAGLVGLVIAPLLGLALGLPVVAMMLLVVQVLLAFPLGVRRGSLIAFHRFATLGVNMLIEAMLRIALGCLAGYLWGATGLVAGLALATLVALALLPSAAQTGEYLPRPITSMFDTWFVVVLLGVLVQLDILLAARGLSNVAAERYDVAAVPSKGVYLVLVAVSILIFPYVRGGAQRRVVVIGAGLTLVLGLAITGGLIVFRDLIASVLGQEAASVPLLACLGGGMSLAGAAGVFVNSGVALGVARPWPPLLAGIVALVAVWATRPTPGIFALAVLAVQACILATSCWLFLRGRRGAVSGAVAAPVPKPFERRWRFNFSSRSVR